MNNNTYTKDGIIITDRAGCAVLVQKPDVIRALEAAGYVVSPKPPEWGSRWIHKATGATVVVTCVNASGPTVSYATTGGTIATVLHNRWYDEYRKA